MSLRARAAKAPITDPVHSRRSLPPTSRGPASRCARVDLAPPRGRNRRDADGRAARLEPRRRAAIEISLRRARLGAVRGDLPVAVVPNHARGAATARTPRRRDRRARRPRDDRRAGLRAAATSSRMLVERSRARAVAARAPDRHLVAALEQASRTVGRLSHVRRRHEPRDVRRRPARVPLPAHDAAARQDDGAVSRVEYRQLRSAAGRGAAAQHPRALAPGDTLLLGPISSSRSRCCSSPTTIRSA